MTALTTRRRFLQSSTGLLLGTGLAAGAEPRPSVPRAISGDAREPSWDERLTITVGNSKADLVGRDDRVLQAAVDYVARLGGGTVKILPGTFRLRNSVYLASNIRIQGSGADSVLIKEASVASKIEADADWYDQEITIAEPKGFKIGDGVVLRAKNPHNGGATVIKRTLVAQSGKRFKLDKALRENLWRSGTPSVATLFPILSGEFVSGVTIEDMTLDGNKAASDHLDGNYSGCIFLQDCNRFRIRQVTARNSNGDGISWQITHDTTVEDCELLDNADLGLHPGSGSQRPIIRRNKVRGNAIGIFFCWGVRDGLAEKNLIEDMRRHGISIGHRDTDNLIRDNTIRRSGEVGVLFRSEDGKSFAPHRNRVEGNRILDTGAESAVAVDIQGEVETITVARNEVRETRAPMRRVGVRIAEKTRDVRLVDNRIEGFAVSVADLRKRE
jgi:hypothetical protein